MRWQVVGGWWLCMTVLAACENSVSYSLYVRPSEPFDRPAADSKPATFVDGTATDMLETSYPDLGAAAADVHVVELRYDDVVVAHIEMHPSLVGCEGVRPVTSYSQTLCSYDSGDLRFDSDHVRGDHDACIADGFCIGACGPFTPCEAGQKCTSRIVSLVPLASHAACAPPGTKKLGEACMLIEDPGGAFDDCEDRLLCVGGTCREACTPGQGSCGVGTCNYIPGHAPELGICE